MPPAGSAVKRFASVYTSPCLEKKGEKEEAGRSKDFSGNASSVNSNPKEEGDDAAATATVKADTAREIMKSLASPVGKRGVIHTGTIIPSPPSTRPPTRAVLLTGEPIRRTRLL